MVPRGSRLADIGSDHAYLPIALCLEGRIECALASDINEGQVNAAEINIQKNNLSSRITAVRADGLDKTRDFAPDCITVLGMGGELIVSILDKAEWIRDGNITLVLQPMTHPEALAKYLAENGFAVIDDRIVRDGSRDDRIYRVISARYDGQMRQLSDAEAYVGRINLDRCDHTTVSYCERLKRIFKTRAQGKLGAGGDAANELKLIDEINRELEKNEGN
jgi:tRNA (adenine22-N1)-methyltransferase